MMKTSYSVGLERIRWVRSPSFHWLGTGALATLLGCTFQPARTPDTYLIPNGYVGWIDVTLGDSSAPPFQKKDGAWLVPIPPTGQLASSTKFQEGWASDHFYYVGAGGQRTELFDTGWGKGGHIWREEHEFGDPKVVRFRFFVGTEAQLESSLQQFQKSIEGKWPWPAIEPAAGPLKLKPGSAATKPTSETNP
jgi:hypothetical protein